MRNLFKNFNYFKGDPRASASNASDQAEKENISGPVGAIGNNGSAPHALNQKTFDLRAKKLLDKGSPAPRKKFEKLCARSGVDILEIYKARNKKKFADTTSKLAQALIHGRFSKLFTNLIMTKKNIYVKGRILRIS